MGIPRVMVTGSPEHWLCSQPRETRGLWEESTEAKMELRGHLMYCILDKERITVFRFTAVIHERSIESQGRGFLQERKQLSKNDKRHS